MHAARLRPRSVAERGTGGFHMGIACQIRTLFNQPVLLTSEFRYQNLAISIQKSEILRIKGENTKPDIVEEEIGYEPETGSTSSEPTIEAPGAAADDSELFPKVVGRFAAWIHLIPIRSPIPYIAAGVEQPAG
jgi:hypothetical protein